MNDNLATKLADVHAALSSLEAALEPVLREQQETDVQVESPLQRARRNVTLGHTAISLFSLYLRTQCVDVNKHPVTKEAARSPSSPACERANRYLMKVKSALDASQARPRTTTVDIRGAKRAVAHYVSDLSAETKKKLRHEDSLNEPAAADDEAE